MTFTEQYEAKLFELRMWYASQLSAMLSVISTEELCHIEGMTRWKLIQILKKANIVRPKARSVVEEDRALSRDGHARRVFGCSWQEVAALTGLKNWHGSRSHPLLKLYWHHKATAQRVKTPWEISLTQYAEIVTPHLGQFGRHKGAKVFARKDKSGVWSVDNVHVLTLQENSFQTNGFSKAHAMQKKRTERRSLKAAELQQSGMTVEQIAKRLRCSRARVCHYLSIAEATA